MVFHTDFNKKWEAEHANTVPNEYIETNELISNAVANL